MSPVTLATGTPTLTAIDNRGLTVRTLQYNRTHKDASVRLLMTHVRVDEHTRTSQWRDPRRFNAWSSDPDAVANLTQRSSLTGQVLSRHSTDSGHLVSMFNVEGRLIWTVDGRGTVNQIDYDPLGRPVARSTRKSDRPQATARVAARYVYGDTDPSNLKPEDHNLRGLCVRQYDEAGKLTVGSVALSGTVLSSAQTFLRSAESKPDWHGAEPQWGSLVEDVAYLTTSQANALGALTRQVDAAGHQQSWGYGVSGKALGHQLRIAGKNEPRALLDHAAYNAAGQVIEEGLNHAVTKTYGYEPETQRLHTMQVARHQGQAVLQALSYRYDPVGNVIAVNDSVIGKRYFRNQVSDAERRFTYDALSRLLTATGRETVGRSAQNGALPGLVCPIPSDDSQYVNYTRSYAYDDSGNLATFVHVGADSYTQAMVTDAQSNRSVRQAASKRIVAEDVGSGAWFDANGNLLCLQDQPSTHSALVWDSDNQLQTVVRINRNDDIAQSDREIYQYRNGTRVRKQSRTLTQASKQLWTVEEVRYLPGLEWRSTYQETVTPGGIVKSAPTEVLQTLVGQAGRTSYRVLHWTAGKPGGLANDLMRYGMDDAVGSVRLEVDAQGQTISCEEYYPFGGTAVWAARNQVEASYKVVRYSGKERDATGLYYYGYRYYAPWLCRWVSADPAGEVDGLNLYRMVRNNPMTLLDPNGLEPLNWLDLARTDPSRGLASAIYATQPAVAEGYQAFSTATRTILQETQDNEATLKASKNPAKRNKAAQAMKFTQSKLKTYAAHAGFFNAGNQLYKDDFLNLVGSLANKNTFPGVELLQPNISVALSEYHPDALSKSKRWNPQTDLGSYKVANEDAFISAIKKQYSTTGTELHALVESRIRKHIAGNGHILPKTAGIAGLHAEVQALNYAVSQSAETAANPSSTLNNLYIYTQRLVGATGEDFPACHNCAGIISGLENVMTGKVKNSPRHIRRHSI